MALIRSISGIRGTIGGKPGKGLTPVDIVKYTAAYGTWLAGKHPEEKLRVVLGRDARPSGGMISDLVTGTLIGMGVDVLDIGLTTTPSAELAVTDAKAQGGVIITASHNPAEWNALKLLNHLGEFLSEEEGLDIRKIAGNEAFRFSEANRLGSYSYDENSIRNHIRKILALPGVDAKAIKKANFCVVVDAVNSTGGIAVPMLLKALHVAAVGELYCEPDGNFPHNPEPLPEHLQDLCDRVVKDKADLGIAVDPDVDRLAFVNELGETFGEEYTLVAVADYILGLKPGNTVSNLSSTQALKMITEKHGGSWQGSAVGEVNVVEKMKETGAVIGGEGNGGVIYPPLHYGRDALVGIALFLTHLAKSGKKCSELRDSYPAFFISKNKIELEEGTDIGDLLGKIRIKYRKQPLSEIDGIRIQFDHEWVHLRKSNTEPILRIYAESNLMEKADNLARKIILDLKEILTGNS
ncbi:MAG TPA: phosphoglucosamine mutase [Bacteroidales bacterium]|nr:phosphoglucosamine mutase [Bacteroidales bacterium]